LLPQNKFQKPSRAFTKSLAFLGFGVAMAAKLPLLPQNHFSPLPACGASEEGAGGWRSVQGFHKKLDFVKILLAQIEAVEHVNQNVL
jgi:hypothetical protein